MRNFKISLIAIAFVLYAVTGFSATNKANWGDDVYINSSGVFYAGQGISLGGTTKTSWGSIVSPWEDSGTTTLLTSAPAKFILTHSSGQIYATKFSVGSGDIALENGQAIDGGTNNAFKFTENSDTLSFTASGNDWVIDSSDGGIIFTLTDGTDGTVDIMANNDADDYIQISTSSNQPLINFVGCNGKITAASGTIDFDDENITLSGTLSSGATTVTSLIIGDETLDVVTDDQFQFKSNDSSSTIEVLGYEANDAVLLLDADQGDDTADSWFLKSIAADNDLHFLNHTTLRLTMSSAGNILTTGDITVEGTTPSVEIGDGGAEDAKVVFDGNAQDFHVGLDDTADDLVIGVGSALGTTTALAVDENTDVTVSGNLIVEGALDLGTVETFGGADATPDVSDGSYFLTHASEQTLTDFDGTGIVAGQIIVVESTAAVTYDVTSSGLKGGTTDLVTADGDLTSWIYNGTDWLLISFMDLSDNLS